MESKKLKANELRKGNVVKFYGNNEPLIIENLNTESANGWNEGYIIHNGTDKTAIDCLYGVPLTEEKLIEFEFEEVIGWDDMIFWREKQWKDKSQWFELMQLNQGFCFDDYINIESVHQLQNLFFSLRNEELHLTNKAINPL